MTRMETAHGLDGPILAQNRLSGVIGRVVTARLCRRAGSHRDDRRTAPTCARGDELTIRLTPGRWGPLSRRVRHRVGRAVVRDGEVVLAPSQHIGIGKLSYS